MYNELEGMYVQWSLNTIQHLPGLQTGEKRHENQGVVLELFL